MTDMRAIIRFSVDGSSWFRNNLSGHLEAEGFEGNKGHGKTATWEIAKIPEDRLHFVVSEFWRRVVAFPQEGRPEPGRLDHFWMYADKVDVTGQTDEASTPDPES